MKKVIQAIVLSLIICISFACGRSGSGTEAFDRDTATAKAPLMDTTIRQDTSAIDSIR
ncbi:hypothetical protein H8S90_16390 [Olivibacter sp. SDN3]|uniref:hypothetical protein n=1 Tax=Olivibacter sp. SDN3 TaxID=2764720 RepID=UPI00165175D8|nr:hypothetical protein [Olivibacter sp. SDN3]QNL48366.1 hypothetical protein H8S90_16390 [Olivibacter sp. SDN3]